ncbi:MAG: hypothetical protein IKO26_01860, partial [Paludibacteraceae bacterium]|nr:hypothetical protein [Paludibacteraceae bacterium]
MIKIINYIQSALTLPTTEKRRAEERPLLRVGDGFKKIIITKDQTSLRQTENGITFNAIFGTINSPPPPSIPPGTHLIRITYVTVPSLYFSFSVQNYQKLFKNYFLFLVRQPTI